MDTLRGLYRAPWLVALFRGILEAAAMAALAVLITAVSEVTAGDLAPYAPFALVALRQIEGVADQIDPAKRRAS